jgi:hypothetical protein
MACGLFPALSVMVIVPLRDPVAVGVNVTLIEQLAPTPTKLPAIVRLSVVPTGRDTGNAE